MNIHILRPEGGILELCQSLQIDESTARKINDVESGNAAPGEELLGLVPTRSYRAVYGDTLERIAIRFGLAKRDLTLSNPWLAERSPRQGETITLKYGERRHGMKVANGYYHDGTTDQMLKRALPYLTYVSFSSAVADRHGVRRIMKDNPQVEMVTAEGKLPLIRVVDLFSDRFKIGVTEDFAQSLIGLACKGGYRGIVLNASSFSHSAKEYSAFLVDLRKLMIGRDLILITEIDEASPIEFSDYADGSIMYYPKFAMENPPSFENGERRVLSDFACRGESAKTFVDLSCVAKHSTGYCSVMEALDLARKSGAQITRNESTLLSHFRCRKQGEYTLQSLKGLQAIFDLIHEYDYMGICFDIMRVPTSYLLMYNAMFKTCYQAGVSSRAEYNREDAR